MIRLILLILTYTILLPTLYYQHTLSDVHSKIKHSHVLHILLPTLYYQHTLSDVHSTIKHSHVLHIQQIHVWHGLHQITNHGYALFIDSWFLDTENSFESVSTLSESDEESLQPVQDRRWTKDQSSTEDNCTMRTVQAVKIKIMISQTSSPVEKITN